MGASFERARELVYRSGRVLEQRLFARRYEGGDAQGVVSAVLAYRNEDGGFGHGLEPDKLAPESQPLDVQNALARLHDGGAQEPEIALRAADWLETIADERGLVPIVLPSVATYPRANHWEDGVFPPAVNCTIGIAGYMHALGIEHPWLTRATETCSEELGKQLPDDAHAFHDALPFVRYAPSAAELEGRLAEGLPQARWFRSDPEDESYGLPLTKFPRDWFDDSLYDAHLDRLESEQDDEGGWPIDWEPPGQASYHAWRAIFTLEALQVLDENGRLER
jgi:hypothetical protein